jgi:hypothetical protein
LVLSVEPRSVLRSYAFLVVTLMFGLPLIVSFYAVGEGLGSAQAFVVAYVAASILVGLTLLVRRGHGATASDARRLNPSASGGSIISKATPFVALGSATLAVASFALMRYLIASSYPYPSASASVAGGVYMLALAVAATIGVPKLVTGSLPVLREALSDRRLRISAYLLGVAYFFTYEVLVNEVVITGYNTAPGNFVQAPLGTYPWAYIFTSGPAPGNLIETAIYSPYALVQLNQYVNLIIQPFEILLAVAISVLVASTVVVTYHTVRKSERMGGACSASATMSGVGAFLGYTATCPSCLAPTLISVVFGGVAAVQGVYSNIWGAVVPPLVSIGALVFSLLVLQWNSKRRFGVSAPLQSVGDLPSAA